MPDFTPYKISHIHLNEKRFILPDSLIHANGNYVVFWWRQIAIGDVYLEPANNISEDSYLDVLSSAITSTVDFYAKQNQCTKDWKSLIVNKREQEWFSFMNDIFRSKLPQNVPKSVPVSVIICTHNRPEQLKRCIQMLGNLSCTAQEIIVVDNAPVDDRSFEVVKSFTRVHYIREPRKGLDIARNTGVRTAREEIVTFIDDDVNVHPLCIFRVWETFKNPSVDAMTGLVIAMTLKTEAQMIFEKFWSFNRGYKDILYDQSFFKSTLHKGPPVWEIGAGANMAFRKKIFDEVGLFDERLDVGAAGCSGDSEIWYRILAHGFSIKYNPRAVVFHEHRKEMKALQKQIFSYMRGHAAAALIQHEVEQPADYKKHIYINLPRHYFKLIKKGFPKYRNRFITIKSELKGILSGIIFYYKNRKKPAQRNL